VNRLPRARGPGRNWPPQDQYGGPGTVPVRCGPTRRTETQVPTQPLGRPFLFGGRGRPSAGAASTEGCSAYFDLFNADALGLLERDGNASLDEARHRLFPEQSCPPSLQDKGVQALICRFVMADCLARQFQKKEGWIVAVIAQLPTVALMAARCRWSCRTPSALPAPHYAADASPRGL
jgi:hypothetical protein